MIAVSLNIILCAEPALHTHLCGVCVCACMRACVHACMISLNWLYICGHVCVYDCRGNGCVCGHACGHEVMGLAMVVVMADKGEVLAYVATADCGLLQVLPSNIP